MSNPFPPQPPAPIPDPDSAHAYAEWIACAQVRGFEMCDLRAQGLTIKKIAIQYGVSRARADQIVRRYWARWEASK